MDGRGRIVALVVAAGSGTRAGGGVPKQYRKIGGKAVLAHAVDHLRRAGAEDIRIVIGPGQETLYAEAVGERTLPPPISGGTERRLSVLNGLEAIANEGRADIVLIHDAARPFVSAGLWARVVAAVEQDGLAVPALDTADTMARGSGILGDAVDRSDLLRVQTPQGFRFSIIKKAFDDAIADGFTGTDEASLAERAGHEVAVVMGSARNIKITTPDDMELAEFFLSQDRRRSNLAG